MTVYIEYVIINNVIIDYLMLKATFLLTGNPLHKRRLFLCAFLGGVTALVYPTLEINQVILTLVKIMAGLLIVLLASEYKSVKSFYVNAVIFFFYTFLTGGVIIGVFNLLGIEYQTELIVASIVIPVYLVLKVLAKVKDYFFRRKTVESFLYKVELSLNNQTLVAKGFLDTGNSLLDNGEPVILCDKHFAKKLIANNIAKIKFKKIEISTATGKRQNLAFKLDRLVLYTLDKEHIFNNVMVCISHLNFRDYSVILHPDLIKENKRDEDVIGIKKVG
ncbi:MAG: sigma-E processing peptidase SpoIIGA [Clostridia bacterium]|nr:sigma-E processing peptidase SpoIIGA [Clostridia bacterium]